MRNHHVAKPILVICQYLNVKPVGVKFWDFSGTTMFAIALVVKTKTNGVVLHAPVPMIVQQWQELNWSFSQRHRHAVEDWLIG